MMLLNGTSGYSNTRIKAQIRLGAASSDSQDSTYYLEVNNLPTEQFDCYIGQVYVTSVSTIMKKNTISSDLTDSRKESVWLVTVIIPQIKTENECYDILYDLCRFFTFESSQAILIQNAGSPTFTFDQLFVEIHYSGDDLIFSDEVLRNHCCSMHVTTIASTAHAQFLLPKTPTDCYSSDFFILYLNALDAKDVISRFVLMYGIIEKIFASTGWQNESKKYEYLWKVANQGKNYKLEQHRATILYHFFLTEGIKQFSFAGSPKKITEAMLSTIIRVRNDLFHRTDITQIHSVLYRQLIPIIKEFLTKL